MTEITPIKPEDIHVGTVGYVEFQLHDSHKHTIKSYGIPILCEVVGITGDQIEIIVIGSNRTCLWIDQNKIYPRIRA